MPLLEILKDKYLSESRDYMLDLMAHRVGLTMNLIINDFNSQILI